MKLKYSKWFQVKPGGISILKFFLPISPEERKAPVARSPRQAMPSPPPKPPAMQALPQPVGLAGS